MKIATMARKIALGTAVLALGWGAAARPAHAARTRRYVLTEKSSFQEGCFPPCDCPLSEPQPVRGRFLLAPVPPPPGGLFDAFAVRGVRWTIGGPTTATKPRKVSGSGTYLLGGEVAVTQRFELDLLLDGSGPAHFDSGFVLAGAAFPEISVTVSRNAMTCFDQVFTIDAAPQSSAAPPR